MSKNKKFIAWGLKNPGDTFRYIHLSLLKAFRFLEYEVFHLDHNDDISGMNFENAVFFTVGSADQNIPLVKSAKYILHHCHAEKYENFNYIEYCLFVNGTQQSFGFSGQKLDTLVYYDDSRTRHSGRMLFQPWATDLLPHEIDDNLSFSDNKTAVWVGSVDSGHQGNSQEINLFSQSCAQKNYSFQHYPPGALSFDENKNIVNKSAVAPIILGDWQKTNGYVPCRFFKNISYGKLALTNSAEGYELVEGNAITASPGDLLEAYLTTSAEKQKKMFKESVKIIKEKHTYLSRISRLLSFL